MVAVRVGDLAMGKAVVFLAASLTKLGQKGGIVPWRIVVDAQEVSSVGTPVYSGFCTQATMKGMWLEHLLKEGTCQPKPWKKSCYGERMN